MKNYWTQSRDSIFVAGVDMAISRGAELITCNNPDIILQLLRLRGRHK
ncbi:MAG: hypothetical protein IKB34_05065 [Clostridia bacterium]|nr:hypothetical protein [Clostridia bacterium]